MKTILSEDEKFFSLMEVTGQPVTLLLGEPEEQWTTLAVEQLTKNDIPFSLILWRDLKIVRQNFQLTRYPVLQCWYKGELLEEIVGFNVAHYRRFVNRFYHLNKGK